MANSQPKAVLLGLVLALAACSGPAPHNHRLKFQGDAALTVLSGFTNRVLTSLQMGQALPAAKVTVNDPVYGRLKRYEGFWLEDVLKLAGLDFDEGSILVISARDGYQARLARLPSPPTRALLAVRDMDQPTGWEVLLQGKESISPGPFYLVWPTASGTNAAELPWPYQIDRLEMRRMDEAQRHLFPSGAGARPDVMRGSALFAKSCLSCHSVNLEGGVLGPELNMPRNITEYRERAYLLEFIRNPSSFRARSKMPGFQDIFSSEDLENLLNYLAWMRNHKAG